VILMYNTAAAARGGGGGGRLGKRRPAWQQCVPVQPSNPTDTLTAMQDPLTMAPQAL
jgi:hypothetical protein